MSHLKEKFRGLPRLCQSLNTFLESETGREMMAILREAARPKKTQDATQHASGQDFVMQLALAHNYRLAQQEMIDLIEDLRQPSKAVTRPPVKPEESMELEDEDAVETPPENSKSKRKSHDRYP